MAIYWEDAHNDVAKIHQAYVRETLAAHQTPDPIDLLTDAVLTLATVVRMQGEGQPLPKD